MYPVQDVLYRTMQVKLRKIQSVDIQKLKPDCVMSSDILRTSATYLTTISSYCTPLAKKNLSPTHSCRGSCQKKFVLVCSLFFLLHGLRNFCKYLCGVYILVNN